MRLLAFSPAGVLWRRAAAGAVLVALAGGVWFVARVLHGLPDRGTLQSASHTPQTTILYDRNDQPIATVFREQRIDVPLARMSPHLVQAIVAIEDRRFFEHGGLDARRILGAAWRNVRAGRAAEGASTITQQLVRQRFLTPDKTLTRKLREAVLAVRIEARYRKPDILEQYLNQAYFGDGLYGVEAAARGYFGRSAAVLDLPQAALLAGLVRAPSAYAPTTDLDRAIARRNVVLRVMRDQGLIDEAAWTAAREAPVTLRDALGRREPAGRYFTDLVRRELVARFGVEAVYEGGLRAYTTLDLPMQRVAEDEVSRSLREIEARQAAGRRRAGSTDDPGDPLQAAVVAIDPATGEVRAMVGGRDFGDSQFNRAVQAKRQPGSAFKPFVYAAALESGYSPASLIEHLDDPLDTAQGAWLPDEGHPPVTALTMRNALRTSSNRAAVRMLDAVGIAPTAAYAARLGLGRPPAVPSMALGSGDVTLLSLTMAYATFADQGRLHHPVLIRRVENADGVVLFEARPSRQRVLSDTTAFLMADMLADVVDAGTGARARRLGFELPAAGKTGTTNDFMDAWFVGFTPGLATGVWIGFDRPRTILRNGYASDLAVPLWTRVMLAATRGDPPRWFAPPPGIVSVRVCSLSGRLPSSGCDTAVTGEDGEDGHGEPRSTVRAEYFVEGTEPREFCDLHPDRSFFATLARAARFGRAPEAMAQHDPGLPPDRRGLAAAVPDSTDEPEAPRRKRGFWARVFGRR